MPVSEEVFEKVAVSDTSICKMCIRCIQLQNLISKISS